LYRTCCRDGEVQGYFTCNETHPACLFLAALFMWPAVVNSSGYFCSENNPAMPVPGRPPL
jgi:hypothetical protein